MIDFYGIPICMMNRIKNGEDYTLEDGRVIPNSELTTPSDPPPRVCLLLGYGLPAPRRSTSGRSGFAVP